MRDVVSFRSAAEFRKWMRASVGFMGDRLEKNSESLAPQSTQRRPHFAGQSRSRT
jgi:hypothetical protein